MLDTLQIGIDENGSKTDFLQQKVGLSIQDLVQAQSQTSADFLGSSGRVFIQKSQLGGGSPMLRGFSTNRLLYALDGVRLNNATYRSGNLQNVIALDAQTFEQTEIILGPSALSFGSDAMGGVFSFKSLDHRFDHKRSWGSTMMRYSSVNQEKTAHVHLGVHNQSFSSITSFTQSSFGDLQMGRYGSDELLSKYIVRNLNGRDTVLNNPSPLVQSPTGYQQDNFMQKFRFELSSNKYAELDFHYSKSSPYPRYDRFQSTEGNKPAYYRWDYGPQEWIMTRLGIGANHLPFDLLDEIDFIVAHQYSEEVRSSRKLNSKKERKQIELVNGYSMNLNVNKKILKKHELQYGSEFIYNDVNSYAHEMHIESRSSEASAPRYPSSTYQLASVYLNYIQKLHNYWIIHGGYRYTRCDLNSDFSSVLAFYPLPFDHLTNQLEHSDVAVGWTFNKNDKTVISGTYASAFRAPNVDDVGKIFDFGPNQVIVPSGNLGAEQAKTLDVNWTQHIGGKFKMEWSIFHTWTSDLLVRRQSQFEGQDSLLFDGTLSQVYSLQNAASGRVYGFSGALKQMIGAHFLFESIFNFQRGYEELESGEISRSRHAAPAFGKNSISFQNKKVRVELFHLWNAAVAAEDLNPEEQQKSQLYQKNKKGEPYVPEWHTLNAKMIGKLTSNFEVIVGVDNLLDLRYRPYSSGLSAPGRNFILAVHCVF